MSAAETCAVCGRHPWAGHKLDCPNRESCTPVTTEFVRRHYSMAPTAYRTDGSIAQMPSAEDVAYCERQFDEWLARHDAEVRAAALSSPPTDDIQCGLGHMVSDLATADAARERIVPPADDVREALAAALDDNRKLRRLLAQVRLRGTVTEPCPVYNWTGPSPQYDSDGVAVHHPSHEPSGTVTDAEPARPRRLRACVEAWPEAESGAYNPACCRFPKSCSATVYDESYVRDEDLEARS